ncbi:MAG: KEOPS complex kinase/ATPase Bud32 [Candidatus Micrarchaeia archaeon]
MNNFEGAEARVTINKINNFKVVLKTRYQKIYREQVLDEKLRVSRTRREAKILSKLMKNKINAPRLIAFGKFTLIMSYVDGILLRDIDKKESFMQKLGSEVNKMHEADIVHGDLTPANIIIENDSTVIIDFGLSEMTTNLEEKALDILLLKRSLIKKEFDSFLISYSNNTKYDKIMDKLNEIEKRGRYSIRTLA